MSPHLYPDFELTIDNCDIEPIHRPIATQGHGHILVIDQKRPDHLYAMNEHCPDWLGQQIPNMWQKAVKSWVPSELREAVDSVRSTAAMQSFDPISFRHHGQTFDAIRHVHDEKAFIEIEPSADAQTKYQGVRRMMERLRACGSLHQLFESIPELVKEITGFDRVMIYQFDVDFHGSVIGEAKEKPLEPFLGLHYPATDIPPLARELFLKNRSRSIYDIALPNDRLLFNPDLAPTTAYLDLSMSQLRATSPMHIEYLEHMGVRATLSLAIVQEGRLWGLFACHHYSPRSLPYEMRKLGETLADLFSHRLSELQCDENMRVAAAARESEEDFLSHIRIEDYYKLDLAECGDSLQKICHADGAAVVSLDAVSCSIGVVPSPEALIAMRDWLIESAADDIFATDDMITTVPNADHFSSPIGGMLAACVSEVSSSYLFWFRLPQRQVTSWAGDPSKSVLVEQNADGDEVRLSPRKSFAKWQQAVEDKSLPWTAGEIAMVERIRNVILKKEFQRTASIVMRNRQEFMQLIYAASHDLQEPLRTQLNYLDLLCDELQGTEHSDWTHFVGRASGAVHRMQALIADLLDYASLGTETKRESVDLNSLIVDIQADLMQAVKKKQAVIRVGHLPCFKGARAELKQLFQNLLSNALKYVANQTIPLIEISSQRDGSFVLFSIQDNGIGIDEAHFQKIFLMFQRLHGKEQYDGTGIGLALCKKIVENYDGKIWVTSTVDKGSTFWIKFHESSLL